MVVRPVAFVCLLASVKTSMSSTDGPLPVPIFAVARIGRKERRDVGITVMML